MTALAVVVAAVECHGIEMFTYFGDGSRIGLPSLEVPIEAYPGIPLRSDRIRARRRGMRSGPGAAVRVGPPGYPRGITIRSMPPAVQPPLPQAGAVAPEPPMVLAPDVTREAASDEAEPPPSGDRKRLRGEAEMITAPAPGD